MPLVLTVADLLARVGVSSNVASDTAALTGEGYKALQLRAEQAYTSHNWSAILEQRFIDWISYMQEFALIGTPQVAGLLLVGIGIARIRTHNQDSLRSRGVGSVLCLALLVSGGGYLFQLFVQIFLPENVGVISAIAVSCQVFAPPIIAITLYIAVLRNESKLKESRLVRLVVISGHYSLTIYLGTSLLCALLAYGLACYSRISPIIALSLAVILFLALSGLCALLNRFGRRGPLEVMVRAVVRILGNRRHIQSIDRR